MPTHTSLRLALLTDNLTSDYQATVRAGLQRAARERGFGLTVFMGRGLDHPDLCARTQNQIFDWVGRAHVDGVVLTGSALASYSGTAAVRRLAERLAPLPTVSIGLALPHTPPSTIDNRGGMRSAVEHLIRAHKCTRIAYLGGPADNEEAQARLEGYRYALEADCIPFRSALVRESEFFVDCGRESMLSILDENRRLDAVVGANDYLALGGLEALRERGVAVPESVRVIGFDDGPLASAVGLSSVAQPVSLLAGHALDSLVAMLEGERVRSVSFSPQLSVRDSCGCGFHRDVKYSAPPSSENFPAPVYAKEQRDELIDLVLDTSGSCKDWWRPRAASLVDALIEDLSSCGGQFARVLEKLAEEGSAAGVSVGNIGRTLLELREYFSTAGVRGNGYSHVEGIWMTALTRITSVLSRKEGQARVDSANHLIHHDRVARKLWPVRSEQEMADVLASQLPTVGIRTCFVGLCSGGSKGLLQPLLTLRDAKRLSVEESFPREHILPQGVVGRDEPLLVSLLTASDEPLGIWVCHGETDILVYEQMRSVVSAALEILLLRQQLSAGRQIGGDMPLPISRAEGAGGAEDPDKHHALRSSSPSLSPRGSS